MATKIVDVTGTKEVKDLPPTRRVFHMEYTDDETGLVYGGEFTIKRLNIGDLRRSAITKAELNGGMPEDSIPSRVGYMNQILAHLTHAIVKAPDWWKPEEFFSGDPIAELYEEVLKFEETFRKPVRKEPQGSEGDSPGQAE